MVAGMTTQQTLLILGASGDLTARLLLPGLGALVATGDAPDLSLVGAGMEDWDDQRWRGRVRDSFATVGADGPGPAAVADHARYLCADVTQAQDLRRLLDACQGRGGVFFAPAPAGRCAGRGGGKEGRDAWGADQ